MTLPVESGDLLEADGIAAARVFWNLSGAGACTKRPSGGARA